MKTIKLKQLSLLFLIISICVGCNGDDESPSDVSFEIGDTHQGGIIFYLDQTQEHGLIASTADQGEANWGCIASTSPTAQSITIGSGQTNTTEIVLNCSEDNIAAKLCSNLTLNGYSDWFLPSEGELELMYMHRDIIGGFDEADFSVYVSSSEFFPGAPNLYLNYWAVDFSETPILPSGDRIVNTNKTNENKIRAIRSF